MTIASAFNEIAVAQGGTAAKSGAITAAIDALNDALAGSDQPQAKTIEQAVRLLGEHIGGGGGGDSQYPIINYDSDTFLLDWTWQQIKDALDAGKTPLIPKIEGGGGVEYVVEATTDGHGDYTVKSITNIGEQEYYTDSADGFPTDD